MDSIELNKTTVNELLRKARETFGINSDISSHDCLTLDVYFKHALNRHKIGTFCIYDGSDNCGEFILESTIRQYDVELHIYRDGSKMLTLKVVINE